MKNKTTQELIIELEEAHKRISELERAKDEQMQTEKALRKSEERCRLLAENAGDYIWVMELDTRAISYASPSVQRIIGYTPQEAMQIPISQRYPPRSLEKIGKVLQEELAREENSAEYTREIRSLEIEAYHKEGHTLWVELTARPIRDADGHPTAILGITREITERRHTQEMLLESKEKLSTTLSSIGDAVIATDTESCITLMNPVAENLTGWLFEKAQGKALSEVFNIVNAHTKKAAVNPVLKALESGKIVGLANHTMLIAKDGAEYQIADSAAPIRDSKGKVTGVVLVFRDVTEEYKGRALLEESEARFRNIFENAVMGFFRTTPDGRILMANPALLKILGYSHLEELLQRNLKEEDELDPKHRRSTFQKRIESDGQVIGLESVWFKKDGSSVFVRENAKAIRDERGKTLYYEGTVEDITEQKQAEKALRESEEKFRGLVEASADWIWETDIEGVCTYCSPQVESILGYKPEEIVGKDPSSLKHMLPPGEDERLKEISKPLQEATLPIIAEENINLHKNGQYVILETSAVPYFDEAGKLLGYRGVDRDITKQRKNEREREALLRNLEHRSMLLETAASVSKSVLSILSPDELLQKTVELIQERFNYYYVGIFLVDEEKEFALLKAGTGEAGKKMLSTGHKLKIDNKSMIGWSVAHAKARIALDIGEEAVHFNNPHLPETRSEMALPLVIHTEAVGSLTVQSSEESAFTEEDITVLQTMVDQLAIATQNARLFEQAQREIDERVRAENLLKESEELFRGIFDGGAIGIALSGADQKFIAANPRLCQMLGYTEEELKEKDFRHILHPDDIELGVRFIEKLFKERLPFSKAELRHIKKNGELLYGQVTVSLLPDKQENNKFNVLSIIEDISEKIQAEKELKKAENYLANIIDSMPSTLIGIDTDGKITQWNSEAERVSGLPPSKALGQPLEQAFPRLASELDRVHIALKTREVQKDPKRAYQQDDQIHYEDVTIYPLIANGVNGAVIRVDDVTEKIHIEELMIQSEKMLSVGGLAAGMAHEINNPLAGMMQTADVMSNRLTNLEIPANQRAAEAAGTSMTAIHTFMESRGIPRMLKAINSSGLRVAEIVDNMLSFARRGTSAKTTVNLIELLDRTLELATTDYDLKKQYDFKTIEITREYEEPLPYVPCESSKIQQVFLNILRNGAQAMHDTKQKEDQESSRFTLRIAHEKNENMVRIEIEDNGAGMDEDTRKRIFEPFFTTKPVGEGTGLGLSVSYFIISENHGGTLDVVSEPNQGANFIIRLPVEKSEI